MSKVNINRELNKMVSIIRESKKKKNIAVIIPSYNQKKITLKLISLLKKQTLVPDIIIVDYSSDGTFDYISTKFKDVTIIETKNDFGGSGSQYIGILYALKKGYDVIILSDNDAYPISKKLIEKLYTEAINNPMVVPVPRERYSEKTGFVDFHPFHFLTLRKEIIEKIGLPIKGYFIWGDDWEYSLRIRKNGFLIKKIDVTYSHPWGLNKSRYNERFYYHVRNASINYMMYMPKNFFLSTILKHLNVFFAGELQERVFFSFFIEV